MVLDELVLQRIGEASEIIKNSSYVTCLTGAGISVESGIRPFRGPGGLWTEKGEPSMDGYRRFLNDPEAYWKRRLEQSSEFGRTILNSMPNPGHYALAELEQINILRYLITQNIDNLHLAAGSKNVLEIHGNGQYLRCIDCSSKWHKDMFKIGIIPPKCPNCKGIVKTDTVMFGEPIPSKVLGRCFEEAEKSDCMIVAGTSATVTPAANLPLIVKRNGGSLIEVNIRESYISHTCDINIFGPSGEVLPRLVKEIKNLS
jgi:NAD-dependent deacetylase